MRERRIPWSARCRAEMQFGDVINTLTTTLHAALRAQREIRAGQSLLRPQAYHRELTENSVDLPDPPAGILTRFRAQ